MLLISAKISYYEPLWCHWALYDITIGNITDPMRSNQEEIYYGKESIPPKSYISSAARTTIGAKRKAIRNVKLFE